MHARRLTLLALLASLTLACEPKQDPATDNQAANVTASVTTAPSPRDAPAATTQAPGGEAAVAADAVKTDAGSADAKAVTRKLIKGNEDAARAAQKSYTTHLSKGRELVQAKKYELGLVELEKARSIKPNDARILSEIGFAALLADKLDEAERANSDSVRFAKDDKLKGASLYNLGRVAQKRGDTAAAITYYERSLALRKNDSVQQRLDALTGEGTGGEPRKDIYQIFESCSIMHTRATTLEQVCAELGEHIEADSMTCEDVSRGHNQELAWQELKPVKGGKKLTRAGHFFVYVEQEMTDYLFGVIEYDGALSVIPLTWIYNPGAFGIFSEISDLSLTSRELLASDAAEPELIYTLTHSKSDSDMGVDEIEREKTTSMSVVGIVDGAPHLLFKQDTDYELTREALGLWEDQEDSPVESPEKRGLPTTFASGATVTFDEDGHVTIAPIKGKKAPARTGTFPLGKLGCATF